jgi:glyoxylase-like metal-dependent hydrolase (beta-lactamase superfamily II)
LSAPQPVPGHPEILRIVAPNPGPMTLAGTNTYVVGTGPAWVIDPGPADAAHIAAVRECAAERGGIGGVVLTHSHADHSDGVEPLGEPLAWGSPGTLDEAAALSAAWTEFAAAGERLSLGSLPAGRGTIPAEEPPHRVGPFELIATPGHAADHVAFVLADVCFCGDLVLGEGSSIVPPSSGGGSLADYMDSLQALADRGFSLLLPGHGPPISDPAAKLAEYRDHRMQREADLLAALERGERSRERLLDAAWADVGPELRPAAAIAMQAHLEKLAREGRIPAASDGADGGG